MPGERFYDEQEAEEILRLAASDSRDLGAMTRERLVATASELGISEDAVLRAEQKLAEERAAKERDKLQAAEYAEYKASRRRQLFSGLGSWLSTSVLLVGLDLIMSHGITWSIWPVGIWGLVEIGHVLEAIFTPGSDPERFQRWKRKKQRREERGAAEAELRGP